MTVPESSEQRARQLLAAADMRIEVVKREINQGALAGLGSEISDYAAALVIAALDTFDEHLKPAAEIERLRAELAEWNTAKRHRAFSHCAQNIGHVTMAAFGEKIAEKVQERAGREQAERERDALKSAVLDIDAHATPFGDIPDDPGYVGTYLVTAGALHRALGKVGHTAPKCQAEAAVERGRQAAEKWRTDLKANERESWAITARHVCAEILAALEGNETDGTANE